MQQKCSANDALAGSGEFKDGAESRVVASPFVTYYVTNRLGPTGEGRGEWQSESGEK